MLYGLPGLNLLGDFGADKMANQEVHGDPNIYFPDGNGSVGRLFVKKLIPDVSAGPDNIEAIVDQRYDYSRLDVEGSSVRLRLNSTVVKATNSDTGVDIQYIRGGQSFKVTGTYSVLACYNMMVPYLCPEMPAEQREALSYNVKIPYLATNVLLRSGKPLIETGAASFYCPGQLHGEILSCGRDFGAHRQSLSEDEPVTLYLIDSVLDGDKDAHIKERYRLGRHKMLAMTFEELELDIREQLAGIFASTSFNVREDVLGITVNRWGHGYSYGYNSLFDPHFEEGKAPHEIARKRFGNITIANSDSGAAAALEVAMAQGIRAVEELS
jgi:spermidine dehydrogenase